MESVLKIKNQIFSLYNKASILTQKRENVFCLLVLAVFFIELVYYVANTKVILDLILSFISMLFNALLILLAVFIFILVARTPKTFEKAVIKFIITFLVISLFKSAIYANAT